MQKTMNSWWDTSNLASINAPYLEELYNSYLQEPTSVANEWRDFFDKLPKKSDLFHEIQHDEIKEYFKKLVRQNKKTSTSTVSVDLSFEKKQASVHDFINQYRLLGHLYSNIDPLNLREIPVVPELELEYYGLSNADLNSIFNSFSLAGESKLSLKQIISNLKKIYCGSIASEYMHISDSQERQWVQERVEKIFKERYVSTDNKLSILQMLTAADGLEKYLASKYPGAKRFGLEGCESLIVALYDLIKTSGSQGMQEVVIGMAHRGRLNVLVNILGKNPSELFDEFEGKHSIEVESGDVKYHQGFSSDVETPGGNVHLSLAFNPSHLEVVNPVVCGSVMARQKRRGLQGKDTVLPIVIHGDAAFAGQGIVMETFNMSQTIGYGVGGTIHIILNNQIGFTISDPHDARSTLYCSDIGKMMSIPIFHVNADDPEAVSLVVTMALAYRTKFKKDVIVDLIGYRRHGHNEADEPAATQPCMYKIIRNKNTSRELYADKLIKEGVINKDYPESLAVEYRDTLDKRDRSVARNLVTSGWKSEFAANWSPYNVKDWRIPTKTGLDKETLINIANLRDYIPDNMILHPRVLNIVNSRKEMSKGNKQVDWGYAETLAYATLLVEGYNVRLSGQDSGRGTFFHRHAVWHNQNDCSKYVSLANLTKDQGDFTVIDSLLSEAGVLAFEYGYSTSEPRALVIWEAQFGDFVNNAQVVIDQFISSGEQKWGRLSGLTMFLPHGYEGQGPEHSSARLERFLQLCAQHNIQVCVPTTPSQIFHMLRRQILRPMRKPLIVLTPKSLLRHKLAVSTLDDLSNGEFLPVIYDAEVETDKVNRIVLCSGKVYYDLYEKREKDKKYNVAIIRIEQLYPFPEMELQAILEKYSDVKDVIWCQEEPLNQGAWYSSQHHMIRCLRGEQKLTYAGRPDSAAPAVGYLHLHNEQQKQLLADALG